MVSCIVFIIIVIIVTYIIKVAILYIMVVAVFVVTPIPLISCPGNQQNEKAHRPKPSFTLFLFQHSLFFNFEHITL